MAMDVSIDATQTAENVDIEAEEMGNSRIALCPPWIDYKNKLACFFEGDPEVHIVYDEAEDDKLLMVRVDNPARYEALCKLLPDHIMFGTVKLRIKLIPANDGRVTGTDLLQIALNGNPHFTGIVLPISEWAPPVKFAEFRKEVAQYYNDDLGDPHGYRSTLYATLAEELFGSNEAVAADNVKFCTEIEIG